MNSSFPFRPLSSLNKRIKLLSRQITVNIRELTCQAKVGNGSNTISKLN